MMVIPIGLRGSVMLRLPKRQQNRTAYLIKKSLENFKNAKYFFILFSETF